MQNMAEQEILTVEMDVSFHLVVIIMYNVHPVRIR